MTVRCHCGFCGAEIEAWFAGAADGEGADDAAFERWRDAPCARCGRTPRQLGAHEPPLLEHCLYCDARFDPAALDEVLLHAFGACMEPDSERPATGIRGVRIEG